MVILEKIRHPYKGVSFSTKLNREGMLNTCNGICQFYGYFGGGLSAVMFLPQLIRIHRTQKAHDVSWMTLWMANVASTMILLYTIQINSTSLMYTSSFSILIRTLTMVYKLYLEQCQKRDNQNVKDNYEC